MTSFQMAAGVVGGLLVLGVLLSGLAGSYGTHVWRERQRDPTRGGRLSAMSPTPATNSDLWHSDEGSGPAVLVIHGAGSNGRMWATDLEPLTQSHRLITFNRRGYPGSGAAPRDWRAHAADAAELVESLDVAPVAVVAHSSGAIAALELAVCRRELVGSLVLLDPAFGAAHNLTPAFAGAVVKARLLWLVGRRRRAIDGWLRFVTSYSTGGSAFERMGEERREALRANAEGVFADLASGDGSHIGAAELASIRAPVNIVTATLSPAFLQKTSAALAKCLPSATTRSLPGAGHAMAFDQPDELLAELRLALDGASSSPAVDG